MSSNSSRLTIGKSVTIRNFYNTLIARPVTTSANKAVETAQSNARAEYDLNVNIEQGSNFYFLTYNGIFNHDFIDYRKGIKLFNKFLCKKTFFNSDTIEYDNYYFNEEFSKVMEEIIENYAGIEENKVASMICFNLKDIYKLINSELYLDENINLDNNIGEPNINVFNSKLATFKNNKIPIYISWGNITPRLVYLKDLNYINSGTNDINKFNNGDYLMNFGPCYFDELFRFNLIINDLINGKQQIVTKSQINSIDYTDTTIYYLIIDGDYYNTALRFFYNYANKITIINLLSIETNKTTTNFNINNLPEHMVTSPEYKNYINEIYSYKQTYNFNRENQNNISDQITNFPNVVLINIPAAENINDFDEYNLGKSIDKSFDLFKKDFNTLTDNQKNKSCVYIKTESFSGEKKLIDILNDTQNYETGDNNGILNSQCNKYFLNNNKVFLSSYHNIEHTIKDLKYNPTYELSERQRYRSKTLNNLRVLSSYNLKTNNLVIDYLNNLNIPIYGNISQGFEPKSNTTIDIKNYSSYQQINRGLLESLLFFYLSIIDIIYNNNSNLDDISNKYKIKGENIYEIYIKYLDLFLTQESYIKSPIFEYLFEELLDKYNSNINSGSNNRYNKYIKKKQQYDSGMPNILNNGLKKYFFRIRTFQLYKFNNDIFENGYPNDIENDLSVYTECDKFESAISSAFYEYLLLKDSISKNSNDIFNLQSIVNFEDSIIIKSYNLTDVTLYSPNLYFKFNNLTNVILHVNEEIISDGFTTKNIMDNIQIIEIPAPETPSSFTITVEITNIKNIYNNNNPFTLYSNTCTVNIT